MDKAIVFGASEGSERLYSLIKERYEIVAFTDNDKNKNGGYINDLPIIPPNEIVSKQWDKIVIASITGMYIIQQQLIDMGIEKSNIDISYMELQVKAREQFLSDFAQIVYKNEIKGAVAEAGVFQGEFAKVINEKFADRKLYLFDTFEGFDSRDITYEQNNDFSNEKTGHLNMTSKDMVLGKMKHVQNCIIKEGYFPETAEGINDTFCFVNLDMDLYKPTLEGLKFFWSRMEKGGVILVHDYFSEAYKGVGRAVSEFIKEENVYLFPIGDSISVGIIKV